MRILFDFQDTIGGAPRSHLEHAKAMKSEGFKIIAVIGKEEEREFFKELDFDVNVIPTFKSTKTIFGKIEILLHYKRLIENKRLNLIYSNRSSQKSYLNVVSSLTGIPLLCARAGGTGVSIVQKVNKNNHTIVYSDESYKEYKEIGFSEDKLHVIRNRIPVKELNTSNNRDHISLLIISNIKKDTYNGLLWFLEFLKKNSNSVNNNISVVLAGKFLNVNDEEKRKFESKAEGLNEHSKITFQFVGWVNNIENYIENSLICIGKGRSILQPIIHDKLGFVISEKGALFECNKKNYYKLRFTNFTGRNIPINENDNYTLIDYLNNLNGIRKTEIKDIVLKDYSVLFLPKKLKHVVNESIEQGQSKSNLKAIYSLLMIYYYKIKRRF